MGEVASGSAAQQRGSRLVGMDAHADSLAVAIDFAADEAAMDYLYDFFDQDLADRVRRDREFVPEGLEDLLAEDSLEDFVWLWLKDTGDNSFLRFVLDGAADNDFSDADAAEAVRLRLREWSLDSPPHIAWFKEDGAEVPTIE